MLIQHVQLDLPDARLTESNLLLKLIVLFRDLTPLLETLAKTDFERANRALNHRHL
jgi:hypothetical protein